MGFGGVLSRKVAIAFGGCAIALAFGAFAIQPAHQAIAAEASAATAVKTGPSGLPVPRFVSLKTGKVNVRVGPGEDYQVAWIFTKPGLPIEVVQEFDTWRRIRDSDGTMGWVFQSLLSGKRTAVVAPWASGGPRPIRASATQESAIRAYLEPGVMGEVEQCEKDWCQISGTKFSGWIPQDQLWGVYPDETIN
jgi:SH3-like domain-containing protein